VSHACLSCKGAWKVEKFLKSHYLFGGVGDVWVRKRGEWILCNSLWGGVLGSWFGNTPLMPPPFFSIWWKSTHSPRLQTTPPLWSSSFPVSYSLPLSNTKYPYQYTGGCARMLNVDDHLPTVLAICWRKVIYLICMCIYRKSSGQSSSNCMSGVQRQRVIQNASLGIRKLRITASQILSHPSQIDSHQENRDKCCRECGERNPYASSVGIWISVATMEISMQVPRKLQIIYSSTPIILATQEMEIRRT
jgi:hypothetical protein